MNFYLQSSSSTEELPLKEEIDYVEHLLTTSSNKFVHTFKYYTLEELRTEQKIDPEAIPVGTLQFVGEYLRKLGLNSNMKPIEIPYFLQKQQFLNREYKILKFDKLKGLIGKHLIKDISVLKAFTPFIFNFDTKNIEEETALTSIKNYKEHSYSIQEYKKLNAEYRILVTDNEAVAVQYYNGNDILLFPDRQFITSIINNIAVHRDLYGEDLPRSYTIDIGVDEHNTNYLLEIHNFISCGTYGFKQSDLLYMYKQGITFERTRQTLRQQNNN